jgi:transglutaminase/protease-like cytokinesis protein 3
MDTSWGSGYVTHKLQNGEVENEFVPESTETEFLPDPSYYIFTHFPVEEEEQLLRSPISLEDFESLVFARTGYYTSGFQCTNH